MVSSDTMSDTIPVMIDLDIISYTCSIVLMRVGFMSELSLFIVIHLECIVI